MYGKKAPPKSIVEVSLGFCSGTLPHSSEVGWLLCDWYSLKCEVSRGGSKARELFRLSVIFGGVIAVFFFLLQLLCLSIVELNQHRRSWPSDRVTDRGGRAVREGGREVVMVRVRPAWP